MTKSNNGVHDKCCDLVAGILVSQGGEPKKGVLYAGGELDVLCDRVYYEVKSTFKPKNALKAMEQIDRAMRHGIVEYGYLVVPGEGVYDVMGDKIVKL